MSNFLSVQGIGNLVHRTTAAKEEFRVAGLAVSVKERLAEGGFGFVDLVTDSSNREFVVSKGYMLD
jgi:hypothetical protein